MLYIGFDKNLSKTFKFLIIILILASCDRDKPGVLDEMPPLYSAPQIVALNTKEGYIINPVTGDSIPPLVNSQGDTLKTGVPVPARGRIIDPQSVAKPKVVPSGKPEMVPARQNVHKIPENLTVVPVNIDALKSFTIGVDTSSFVLVNKFGDTVLTGVPIPAKGTVVPCRHPQPVRALPPLMKDNAHVNIKYLDVEQGMNQTAVTSILEDSHGRIWIGTLARGVSLYDGETFTHFTRKEGLSHDWITSLLEDSHGNLWIGAGDGVNMYDGKSFTHFTKKRV